MFKSALSRTSGTACGWRHHAKSRFPVSLTKARLSTNPTLRNKSLQESKESTSQVSTKVEQVKENVKTVGYGGVILAGLGIGGVIGYTILKELFSSESPVALFQAASDRCMAHEKVQDLLGEPIKAFGEETRRGRRRHVMHTQYVDENGKRGTRIQFYLQGVRKRGTAQLDAREDSSGSLKTRFLLVQADDLLGTTVVVEDNR